MTDGLPYFERPPVVESVLGVQFDPLPDFRNAHLVLFWQLLGESAWPNLIDAQPIQTSFERFGDRHKWAQAGGLKISPAESNARLQITNPANDRMVQVQNGRLHYNWKQASADPYPRYAVVRAEFDAVFEQFQEFVRQRGLRTLRLNQWEVTYVNHIEQGDLWHTPADWHTVLPGLLGSAPTRPNLEGFRGAWRFEIEPERGRIHVGLQHGKRLEEPESELLRLDLTGRGPIDGEGGLDLDSGLNLGHETVVQTFVAITSDEAHRHWRRKR